MLHRQPPQRRPARGGTEMARRLLLPTLLVLGACTLGPDYHRPDVAAPATFREIHTAEAASLADTAWWDVFDDPRLQELIRVALVENRDLKIAAERVEEARARYGFSRSYLWPSITAGMNAGRLKTSEGSFMHTPEGDLPGVDRDSERDIFTASADLSWEIDLFGRIRRTSEAELELMLGTEEARRGVVLTLVADVAQTWFELGDFDRRLAVALRTVDSRREYMQLARDRFEGGITPEIDSLQAEAELRRIESIAADLTRAVALKENQLSVLLGRNPGEVLRGRPVAEQNLPEEVPAGLPSDLLERRPDIKEAEHALAAATANIGAAKALLFPRIALTGSYGVASTDFDDLFDSESKSWNVIGNVLQPIFEGGRNRRRVEVTESQQRQALYAYENTVLGAFRETEDALVTYRTSGEQRTAQTSRVAAERKVLDLAETRYRGGVAAYLEVLDAQRSLFDAEIDEAQSIGAHLSALVGLYRALGGGWPEVPQS
jgi:multidrug efflux system outer membrane protein